MNWFTAWKWFLRVLGVTVGVVILLLAAFAVFMLVSFG